MLINNDEVIKIYYKVDSFYKEFESGLTQIRLLIIFLK